MLLVFLTLKSSKNFRTWIKMYQSESSHLCFLFSFFRSRPERSPEPHFGGWDCNGTHNAAVIQSSSWLRAPFPSHNAQDILGRRADGEWFIMMGSSYVTSRSNFSLTASKWTSIRQLVRGNQSLSDCVHADSHEPNRFIQLHFCFCWITTESETHTTQVCNYWMLLWRLKLKVFFLNDTFSPGLLATLNATGNFVSAKKDT